MDTDPIYYDIVIVQPPANDNVNVNVGDELNIYIQDEAGTDFSFLKTYTYTFSDTWTTDPPLYWEDIEQDPAILRASIIAAEPLNNTQLPDILLADQISVNRYNPANFMLSHALSKVMVRLQSDTFSESDLNSATLTLPDYLTGGYEENGAFVEGTTRQDILVDRTDSQNSVAIFQPQTIDPADPLLAVTINGRPYHVKEVNGFTYAPGVAYTFIVTVHKEEVSVSVTVIDWTEETIELKAITIGTAISGGTGILDGEQLIVYTWDETNRQELTTFTYQAATDSFIANPVVYWEALDDPTTFYGYIERATAYNDTQLPDWLVATPVTVAASNGVHFELSHATAQIAVRLISTDGTFSEAERQGMGITLPGYLTGATLDNGIFQPGTTTGNITVATGVGSNTNSGLALIQPQTIQQGNAVLQVIFNGRTYTATYDNDITYPAGVTTILEVDMSKTGVSISANVVDWETGENITLVPIAFTVTGTLLGTEDFFKDKTIYINKLSSNTVDNTYPYTYTNGTDGYEWSGTPIYWDDQPNLSLNLTAIYSTTGQPTLSGTTFAWNIRNDQSLADNSYYDHYDLLVSRADLSDPQMINFNFTHATSKVIIKLIAGTGFEESELVDSTIVLNNFALSGTMDLTTGTLINPTNTGDVVPKTETDGVQYSALVMPQDRVATSVITTITLPGYPGTPFQAITSEPLSFVGGKETIITITVNKTAIELSAQLAEWGEGDKGGIIIEQSEKAYTL
ncbi:MAG: fimbrillin family protein [Bacteroides sp.]|nr:fimbrillin family protein [Bacteroides sp.]